MGNIVIGFNHGLPCYVSNMSRGTQLDKKRGRRLRFLSWLRPDGQVFDIAWQGTIKIYFSMFSLRIKPFCYTKMHEIAELDCNGQPLTPLLSKMGCRKTKWAVGCLGTCIKHSMIASSNGNIFRVTGPLCGESPGRRWIPCTKASDAELSCFLWSAAEWMVEQTMETLVIWEANSLIMTSL